MANTQSDNQDEADTADNGADTNAAAKNGLTVEAAGKPEKFGAWKSGKAIMTTILQDPMVQSVVTGFVSGEAAKQLKKPGIGYTILGLAATRIATRSLPGAMVVGAGLAAKTIYDHRKKQKARQQKQQQQRIGHDAEPAKETGETDADGSDA
ncbi:MAG: hypothetical protein AAFX04_08430 [Pseudomonadota bacterium]